jgi:hypothetical protein
MLSYVPKKLHMIGVVMVILTLFSDNLIVKPGCLAH